MQQDEQGFYDIYGTMHIPFWKTKLFFIAIVILSVICVLICLCALYFVWRRRSKKIIPTRIRVMQELAALQHSLQQPADAVKILYAYVQLGLLLREFLADMHNDASLLTYTEPDLLKYIITHDMQGTAKIIWQPKFADLFARMSGAKYANVSDAQESAQNDVAVTIEYLKSVNTKKE